MTGNQRSDCKHTVFKRSVDKSLVRDRVVGSDSVASYNRQAYCRIDIVLVGHIILKVDCKYVAILCQINTHLREIAELWSIFIGENRH